MPFDITPRAALGILACAVTALVYQRALDLPFVFDDRATVLLNPALVDLRDVRTLFFHDPARTVVNLSYAVDRAFWGFSSFGFHLTNFVLHVVAAGLFYGWCTRALADGARLGSGRGQTGVRPGSDPSLTPGLDWPAFFATAVFALHPLMGATAAYVSARSELLCVIGVLAALTYARRAIVGSSRLAALLAAGFGALAVGSSEAAAGLPLVILAYDAWVLRDSGWRRRLWRVYLPAMALIALAVAWDLPAVLAAPRVPPRGLADNFLTEAIVIWRYAGLLVIPAGQSVVHQVHWVRAWADPLGLLATAGLAAAAAWAVRARHGAPLVAFGAVWFLAALAASSFAPLRDGMAEPRTYVASAGLLLAAASWLARPLATRRAARIVAVAALAALTVLTLVRQRVWADPLRLWEESVQRAPDAWLAHLGYAEALKEIAQCRAAIPEYEKTLELNPSQPDAVNGLKRCRAATE